MMRSGFLLGVAALALSACTGSSVPDSGVGFDDYQSYDAAQAGGTVSVSAPSPVETSSLDGTAPVAGVSAGATPGVATQAATTEVVTGADGISNENNFDAVSAQRDIEDDAALIAQNRAQYQIIAPTDLPPRPNSSAPNIVAYALQTTNPKGVALYDRSGRYDGNPVPRACGAYNSSDLAQEAFLSMGGPQRDRRGLDPDGDGFACAWDPAPFRAARGG